MSSYSNWEEFCHVEYPSTEFSWSFQIVPQSSYTDVMYKTNRFFPIC